MNRPPLTDAEVGHIEGLPTEADIQQKLTHLSEEDTLRVKVIYEALARSLGSYPAARLWLTTTGCGWEGSPLDAIVDGKADLVLEVLEAQWGPNPPYA
jgi:hypothetical protein